MTKNREPDSRKDRRFWWLMVLVVHCVAIAITAMGAYRAWLDWNWKAAIAHQPPVPYWMALLYCAVFAFPVAWLILWQARNDE